MKRLLIPLLAMDAILMGQQSEEKNVTDKSYSLSQNGWDTLGSPCPLNVGVQDLVTKPR